MAEELDFPFKRKSGGILPPREPIDKVPKPISRDRLSEIKKLIESLGGDVSWLDRIPQRLKEIDRELNEIETKRRELEEERHRLIELLNRLVGA